MEPIAFHGARQAHTASHTQPAKHNVPSIFNICHNKNTRSISSLPKCKGGNPACLTDLANPKGSSLCVFEGERNRVCVLF